MYIAFRARRWSEEDLAKRICQILYGDDKVWKEDGGSRRWHIGTANDAWLHPKNDDVFVLHYRYCIPARQHALSLVLEWRLGVELVIDVP